MSDASDRLARELDEFHVNVSRDHSHLSNEEGAVAWYQANLLWIHLFSRTLFRIGGPSVRDSLLDKLSNAFCFFAGGRTEEGLTRQVEIVNKSELAYSSLPDTDAVYRAFAERVAGRSDPRVLGAMAVMAQQVWGRNLQPHVEALGRWLCAP